MAEWLVEEGIGEHRAALVDDGHIVAAKLAWPGGLAPGQIEQAVLVSRATGSSRGTARFASGELALVDGLPREAREGAPLGLEVVRAASTESERGKLAWARPTALPARTAPTLAEAVGGRVVRQIDGWDEVWAEGFLRTIPFPGGSLTADRATAMTVIDVDGDLAPAVLALAAVPAVAATVRRLDLSGSIVIDFPTLSGKADRKAVDLALGAALGAVRHEATAMNGFGLVQLVIRRERPSLLDLLSTGPAAAARMLLRRAERVSEPGVLQLSASQPVRSAVRAEWEAELARRTGRSIEWRIDNDLAAHASFAQAIAR